MTASRQGLTFVHISVQPEPFLPLNMHPEDPLNTPYALPEPPLNTLYTPPIPQKVLMLSWKVDECKPLPHAWRPRGVLGGRGGAGGRGGGAGRWVVVHDVLEAGAYTRPHFGST